MRRKILTATATLTLILTVSAAPADASVFGLPNRPPLDLQNLVSWATSWLTGLWAADEGDRGTNLDPDGNPPTSDPIPTDPEPMDDRGTNLDPDG